MQGHMSIISQPPCLNLDLYKINIPKGHSKRKKKTGFGAAKSMYQDILNLSITSNLKLKQLNECRHHL